MKPRRAWVVLGAVALLLTGTAGAATYHFDQVTTPETVCSGTTAATITTATVSGTQTTIQNNIASAGDYHLRMDANGFNPTAGQMMYTPAFAACARITANATVALYSRASWSGTRPQWQVRVYDVDPAAACGTATLVGQSAWTNNAGSSGNYATTNLTLDNATYQVAAGHRLRLEVWFRAFSGTSNCRVRYGQTSTDTILTTSEGACAFTTVGNGVDPAGSSRCPGGGAAGLDAFTLQTTTGTDTVTALEVTFAAGTATGVGLLEVTNDTGSVVHGVQADPAATQNVTLTTPITATTALTQYRLRMTPRGHPAMPAPPGAAFAVAGRVTGLTNSNQTTYGDTTSATVTIDNQSPVDPGWVTITPGNGQVAMTWTNPGGDFDQTVMLRATASISDAPSEGASYSPGSVIGASTVVFAGGGTSLTDTGVSNGTPYWYKAFARDVCGNYSTGAQTGPHTPIPPTPPVTPGPASANVDGCDRITVTAPFTGDTNGDSTTSVERAASSGGPWSTVCAAIGGGNPRRCVDAVAPSSTWYFRVTFDDPDGVSGTNPQVIGPFVTPACGVAPTTVVGSTVQASSCRQLTVTSVFTGDDNGNGSTRVEFNTADSWPGTVSCAALTGTPPRQCLVVGLAPSTQYWVRVTVSDPDGVSGPNPEVLWPVTTPSCGGDQVAPTVMFASPTRDAVIGGTERFKVQVFDAGDPPPVAALTWSVDDGPASSFLGSVNAAYNCNDPDSADRCRVHEFDLDTTVFSRGRHRVTVRATDASGNVAVTSLSVVVNNLGTVAAGSGTLLRRSTGSQLCVDCHNLQTHSSQYTSSAHGNWSVDCLVCHTAHQTRSIYLVRETLQTPNSGTKGVVFQQDDRSGGTNPQASYLGLYDASSLPYDDGICEVCHTRTSHYRNVGGIGDHTHNRSVRCVGCHVHEKGFAAKESRGCAVLSEVEARCSNCHSAIWDGVTGGVAMVSAHRMGATVGINDACADSGLTWGGPAYTTGTATFTNGSATVSGTGTSWTAAMVGAVIRRSGGAPWYDVVAVGSATSLTLGRRYAEATTATAVSYEIQPTLSQNPAGLRSCVNMCHPDHVHNTPGGTTHDSNLHQDATSAVTRAVTRDATGTILTGTPDRTDFEPGPAYGTNGNGGTCLSCHRFPVNAARPALDKAVFDASAHDYTSFSTFGAWTYTLHDGSVFARNCTKCHADRADEQADASGPFGAAHYSGFPSLLSGRTSAGGVPGELACNGCHGDGTDGVDRSGKAVAQDMRKTGGRHPVNSDSSHSTPAEASVAYSATGNVFLTSRHVNCLDCHDPHAARAGSHSYSATATTSRNRVSNPLMGVSGVQFAYSGLGNFGVPGSSSYTWLTSSAGAAYEYEICFKCHSSFAWGTSTPPNGQSPNGSATTPVETDTAQEFNPENRSGHPVVTGLNNYTGSLTPRALQSAQLKAPWNTNVGTQTMMCSDCHTTDAASPAAQGPHGSAVDFMLRGPNTLWPATSNLSTSVYNTTFCANCHTYGNHNAHTEHEGRSNTQCYACHVVVPHGSKLSRLIGDSDSINMPDRYAYNNDKNTMQVTGFNKRNWTTGDYAKADCGARCTNEHPNTNGEDW